jgi:hypothetical protein
MTADRSNSFTGLSYEDKLEHIIEHIILNLIAPTENCSTAETYSAIRQCVKVFLRVHDFEIPSDAVIDEIARELVEWHAPRPDEEGYDAAAATPEQRLMIANRRRADAVWAERQREYAAKREETAGEDRLKHVREDAERRRQRGDHEGAAFLEQWIARQTAKGASAMTRGRA